jgi:hypothetical protein
MSPTRENHVLTIEPRSIEYAALSGTFQGDEGLPAYKPGFAEAGCESLIPNSRMEVFFPVGKEPRKW